MNMTYSTKEKYLTTASRMGTPHTGHITFSPSRKKLGNGKGGIFIVEVNPWNISVRGGTDPDDPATFRESERFIINMHVVNYLNPNLECIIKHYTGPYYKDIYSDLLVKSTDKTILKRSGWLRVDISMDSSIVAERKDSKFSTYRKLPDEWSYSELRVDYLEELLRFLERNGDAYVVRMPVSRGMYEIESRYMPNFDARMGNVAQSTGAEYISFFEKSGDYRTTDGNHLWRKDARRLTSNLADRIDE
ncbi:hypothetical protein GGQ00_003068 [Salinibacter ruber]|uniref:hypothetical protein n=1 Tax=Salinibacter ruber TaxID=146919 RepID=UPI0021674F50|nr:hypothetical protein [Salinibacter ruber]MCS4044608.1 hypothetical protein [Salinibacter ruber]